MRYPATAYEINGIAPSPVPFWQYTGTGYVPVSISLQSSSASAQYDIPGDDPLDLVRFEQYMLGWSYKDVNSGLLKRYTPAFCPVRPYMFASHITGTEGLANTGQFAGGPASPTWKLMRYTVQFETMPYRVLTDAQLGAQLENKRFTSFDQAPNIEVFKRDRGQFKWPPIIGVTLANVPINDGIAILVCKEKMTVTWHQLPDDGLFNGGGFFYGGISPKIDNGLGKVNSVTFMGRTPGTMLLESWKPVLRTMPDLDLVDLTQAGDRSVFRPSWDAQFVFSYFKPPIVVSAGSDILGHNCVPHPTTGTWYRPYLAGGIADTDGSFRYESYDMNKLFELN